MARRIFLSVGVCAVLALCQPQGVAGLRSKSEHDVPTKQDPAEHTSLLSAWASAASRAADFLGQPSGRDDDDVVDAFILDLTSRDGVRDVLDLVYRRHPRLRVFLIGLLLSSVAELGLAVPLALAACFTGGYLPFLRSDTAHRHCLACFVVLGLLAVLAFGDLTAMVASHLDVADSMRRLPPMFLLAASELRRYAKQTVSELLEEFMDDDPAVAQGVQTFIYGVVPNETLARIATMNCLVAVANESLASKLRRCKDASADMLMPGAIVPNVSDIIRGNLHLQLNRTLESLDQLELNVDNFERRTRLWSNATVINLVAAPIVVVLLCISVTFLTFGVTSGIRNYMNLPPSQLNTCRCTGVIMLTSAALFTLFLVLATPLLMTMATTGVLGECYVCSPYRQLKYPRLDGLVQLAWPDSERGLLLTPLTLGAVFTKCRGEGASIIDLKSFNRTTYPYLTLTTSTEATKRWMLKLTTNPVQRNATAGNCKPVYNVLEKAMNLLCYKFLDNHLSITLSFLVAVILSIVVLPLAFVASQHFFAPNVNVGAGDIERASSGDYDWQDSSRRDVNFGIENVRFSPSRRVAAADNASSARRPVRSWLSLLSNPWRERLDEIYRQEGVDIYDAINRTSPTIEDTSTMSSDDSATTAFTSTAGITTTTKDPKRVHKTSRIRGEYSAHNQRPAIGARRTVQAAFADEAFPRSTNLKSRLPVIGRKSSLATITEQPEASLRSGDSMLSPPSLSSREWCLTRIFSRRDSRNDTTSLSSERQSSHRRQPTRVTFCDEVEEYDMTQPPRRRRYTYPMTAPAYRHDDEARLCGGEEVVYH